MTFCRRRGLAGPTDQPAPGWLCAHDSSKIRGGVRTARFRTVTPPDTLSPQNLPGSAAMTSWGPDRSMCDDARRAQRTRAPAHADISETLGAVPPTSTARCPKVVVIPNPALPRNRHVGRASCEDPSGHALATVTPASQGGDGPAIEVLSPEDVLEIGLGSDILIADDHASNLVAYEAALAPLGRKLVLAHSGVEALAKLLDQDFALVVLDVSMPGMNGLETARMIRGRARSKTTPIIFITGMSSPGDVMLEAYEVGAFDFVIKPIPPEVLRAKARVYLALQERTKELLQHARRLREANKLIRETATIAATARRLEKLQEATQALSEARTPAEVAAVAVRLGAEAVEASAAVMWSTRVDGSLVVEASHQVPDGYLDNFRVIPPGAPHPIT